MCDNPFTGDWSEHTGEGDINKNVHPNELKNVAECAKSAGMKLMLSSTGFDDTSWAIWQYHDDEKQSGIVMAFRRSNSPFSEVKIDLKGLIKGRKYIFKNFNNDEISENTSEFKIVLPEKRSSVIFEYTSNQ